MHTSQATDKDIAGFYKHLLFDILFLILFPNKIPTIISEP
jgi:hypothetical protein